MYAIVRCEELRISWPNTKKAVDSAAGFSSISTNHVMTECDTIVKQQTNLFFEPRFGTPIFLANK